MHRSPPFIAVFIYIAFLLFPPVYAAGEQKEEKSGFQKLFVDTLDQSLDISEFLRTRYGFAFIPLLITEPAIGYGAGGGLMFIHRDRSEITRGQGIYPSVSALGGFYTENKSWGIGGGHFGVWNEGNIRYRGGAGYVSANLEYYREPQIEHGVRQVGFNIIAYGIIQELIFRIKKSNYFAGASYGFGRTTVHFELPVNLPEISSKDYATNIGGLGAVLYYDNRDNLFTPDKGIYAGIRYIYYDHFLGSNRKFQRLYTHFLGYLPLTKKIYAALRLDLQTSFEDTPFYMRPFISLRGIPALRYQGKTTCLAETEFRWDFTYRWSLVGFTGYGLAFPKQDDWANTLSAYNFGVGFRYLLARLYGARMGVDIARGPEDWAFYIQFGSSWFRY